MIEYERKALQGVPDYRAAELLPKRREYCLLIPVINEGARILTELGRAQTAGVDTLCDIVICDGGSTDGSMKLDTLQLYGGAVIRHALQRLAFIFDHWNTSAT